MPRPLVLVLALTTASLAAACSTGDAPQPESGSVPSSASGYLSPRLRRLGSRELAQSIRDVTGIEVEDARVAPLFTQRKYDNGDPDAWVTSDVLAATEDLAWFVADEVIRTRPARVFGAPACEGSAPCRLHILDAVLPRVYRRALSAREQAAFEALWSSASETQNAQGAQHPDDERVRSVIAAALQSPVFLYREEVGQRIGSTDVALLEPREIAPQISFLVVGGPPDDALLDAARDDRLLDPEQRIAQVTRLLATPAAAALQRHFLDLYLATAELPQLGKSGKTYPGFSGQALSLDLGVMLDDAVRAGGSTRELLSRPHHVGASLAPAYGEAPPIVGVLTHPGFLATHGGFEHSNPIARGLFVLTNLLCAAPPPPPAGIPRAPSAQSKAKTTRGKFAEHSQGSCQGCHQAIDGIGFGFEAYDGSGRFRETENGEPIDDTGRVPVDGKEIAYEGAGALGARLATSQQVADCFGRHVVRFALGAGERVDDKPLYEALAAGAAPDTSYGDRIRRVVASDAFIKRRTP